MAPKLYMMPMSAPVRSVLLCAKALGLQLDMKEMSLFDGDHRKPEFIKVSDIIIKKF